jgi:monovalent cation/proton antiporter MnhG/PhaG subunit
MKIIGIFLLYTGIALTVVGVIGLFRFSDTYTRVKSMALLSFPGAILIHTASSLLVPFAEGGIRGLITALVYFLSGPVLSHAILLSAHLLDVPREYKVDELEGPWNRKEQ